MKIKDEVTKRLVKEGVCISKSVAKRIQVSTEDLGALERYIFRQKMKKGGDVSPHYPEDKDYDIMHL